MKKKNHGPLRKGERYEWLIIYSLLGFRIGAKRATSHKMRQTIKDRLWKEWGRWIKISEHQMIVPK